MLHSQSKNALQHVCKKPKLYSNSTFCETSSSSNLHFTALEASRISLHSGSNILYIFILLGITHVVDESLSFCKTTDRIMHGTTICPRAMEKKISFLWDNKPNAMLAHIWHFLSRRCEHMPLNSVIL